ncbi:hypothetical protein TSUD_66780 [Trifolium subterraneum]|uniref:Uncharacterized protein n=1 Tax=Trifolium subterraneum TaxID=3900 RepID=A0A2Z6MR55_TRISU|nr:hypothetical protein TSUD_66780 [Trifolium subterraneum]
MEEQDTSEFTSGVEVSPIDSRVPITRVLHKRFERWVERSQMSKVRRVFCILVVGVNGGPIFLSFPLLIFTPHF